ncbi:putative CmcJ-like methyltransferase [Lasiosphaeria ovina]|uniref:CmcJ-like methyltransferase n=1 Tax=Lasiosphaeria ovina TaxID=92902 RepID=A0AAE0KB63_9PEZI|nr:putative CmcJ-like methyltransferase [Lasiosphaeria ovina]
MDPTKPLSSIQCNFYFLKRNDELYNVQRPYAFKFPPNNGCPMSNLVHHRVDGITVEDMRGRKKDFQFEKNGFAVLDVDTGLEYDDHFDPAKAQGYFSMMEGVLKEHLGASRVDVFRHGIRKRHPLYPVSDGSTYEYDQPTTVVHIDATLKGTKDEIRWKYGEEAGELLKKRFQWINFWKPLRGPTNDWPLCVCDSSTIDRHMDLEISDLLYPDRATENSIMYYRDGLKFYFLSDHQPDEVIVFKQMDSLASACPGVPHVSSYSPLVAEDEKPRESIEGRALVFY